MKLIEINWQPNDRQLRQFGVICLVALPGIAWLWGAGTNFVGMLAGVGVVLAGAGMLQPRTLKPLFLLLTFVATPIGLVIGEIAMLLIYFGVFLPFGLFFRVVKRDALKLMLDRNSESYWEPKSSPTDVSSYYHQS